ncbi:MAG: hypothetical protein JNK84_21865 [Phreatobacter sp.]|uniref:hypothetical protein n=1 Tax=Phreatobacter sp. TaxID=1966341 RepID=UPI001A419728|nr:hypothetical protein [Phreatobacter sp.]MBL8571731.1 hypothetical protein [Phreatobacter sp.]
MKLLHTIVATAGLAVFTSSALAYCSEPSSPSCIIGFGRFADEMQFRACRMDMERYKSDLDEYRECLIRDARRKVESATDEFNEAVRRFNDRANTP